MSGEFARAQAFESSHGEVLAATSESSGQVKSEGDILTESSTPGGLSSGQRSERPHGWILDGPLYNLYENLTGG